MSKNSDIKGVVSRQKRYATLAENEGNYAMKKAKQEARRHEPEMKKDSEREARIAFGFSAFRKEIAEREAKKLKKK
ncbi:MAG: hypothetical protein LLG04_18960 [Parachlamydia sp.]|nr:hypothetical protein [Parachlamydia sp.]